LKSNSLNFREMVKVLVKLLFFSSDWTEVELVRKAFVDAKIPCEVRIDDLTKKTPPNALDAQLWIQNEQDSLPGAPALR
jgi:hypothetical protein